MHGKIVSDDTVCWHEDIQGQNGSDIVEPHPGDSDSSPATGIMSPGEIYDMLIKEITNNHDIVKYISYIDSECQQNRPKAAR